MRATTLVVTLASASLAAGCATPSPESSTATAASERPIRDVIKGQWATTAQKCAVMPLSMSFSDDGAVMHSAPPHGLVIDGKPVPTHKYLVLSEGPRHLRMVIEGEGRRTPSGHVVIWDLVLLSENSFCWHRGDWASGDCTETFKRCPTPSRSGSEE